MDRWFAEIAQLGSLADFATSEFEGERESSERIGHTNEHRHVLNNNGNILDALPATPNRTTHPVVFASRLVRSTPARGRTSVDRPTSSKVRLALTLPLPLHLLPLTTHLININNSTLNLVPISPLPRPILILPLPRRNPSTVVTDGDAFMSDRDSTKTEPLLRNQGDVLPNCCFEI